MVYLGTVKDGKVIPEPGARLVEGSTVRIEPVETTAQAPAATGGDDPADDLARFAVRTGIKDLAENHDHYCSGAPLSPSNTNGRP
jgi:hypothetical protein